MMSDICGSTPACSAAIAVVMNSAIMGIIRAMGAATRSIWTRPQTAGASGLRLMTPNPAKAVSVMSSFAMTRKSPFVRCGAGPEAGEHRFHLRAICILGTACPRIMPA